MMLSNILKWFFGVLIALTIVAVFWLNLLELTQVVRSKEQIQFVQLLEKEENVREKLLSGLYLGLQVDYCYFTNTQEEFIYKLLYPGFYDDNIAQLEALLNKTLKADEDWLRTRCVDDRSLSLLSFLPTSDIKD